MLVGAPMDARSFARLAHLIAVDHTVLTTDPRGINRSPVTAPSGTPPPSCAPTIPTSRWPGPTSCTARRRASRRPTGDSGW